MDEPLEPVYRDELTWAALGESPATTSIEDALVWAAQVRALEHSDLRVARNVMELVTLVAADQSLGD